MNTVAELYEKSVRRLVYVQTATGDNPLLWESIKFPLNQMEKIRDMKEEDSFPYHYTIFQSFEILFYSNLVAFLWCHRYEDFISEGKSSKEAIRLADEAIRVLRDI